MPLSATYSNRVTYSKARHMLVPLVNFFQIFLQTKKEPQKEDKENNSEKEII